MFSGEPGERFQLVQRLEFGSLPVMTWQSRWQCGLASAVLSSSLRFAADSKLSTKLSRLDTNSSAIELRGRLVPINAPVTHAAFRTESGEIYPLLSNRMSSALFLDTNLQSR